MNNKEYLENLNNQLDYMINNVDKIEIKEINRISNKIDKLLNHNICLSEYLNLLDKSILVMEMIV